MVEFKDSANTPRYSKNSGSVLVRCCSAEISCLVRFFVCRLVLFICLFVFLFCQCNTGLTHLERFSLEEMPLSDWPLVNYVDFFFFFNFKLR